MKSSKQEDVPSPVVGSARGEREQLCSEVAQPHKPPRSPTSVPADELHPKPPQAVAGEDSPFHAMLHGLGQDLLSELPSIFLALSSLQQHRILQRAAAEAEKSHRLPLLLSRGKRH